DRRGVVEIGAVLIEVGDLRVLAEDDLSSRGRDLAADGPEEGGLAGAVPAHDAEPLARGEDEVQALDEGETPEGERELLELEDGLARPRRLDGELCFTLDLRGRRGLGRLGALDAGLLLARPGLGLPAQPLELGAEEILPVLLGARLVGEALRL